jgi:hypothetical protein
MREAAARVVEETPGGAFGLALPVEIVCEIIARDVRIAATIRELDLPAEESPTREELIAERETLTAQLGRARQALHERQTDDGQREVRVVEEATRLANQERDAFMAERDALRANVERLGKIERAARWFAVAALDPNAPAEVGQQVVADLLAAFGLSALTRSPPATPGERLACEETMGPGERLKIIAEAEQAGVLYALRSWIPFLRSGGGLNPDAAHRLSNVIERISGQIGFGAAEADGAREAEEEASKSAARWQREAERLRDAITTAVDLLSVDRCVDASGTLNRALHHP